MVAWIWLLFAATAVAKCYNDTATDVVARYSSKEYESVKLRDAIMDNPMLKQLSMFTDLIDNKIIENSTVVPHKVTPPAARSTTPIKRQRVDPREDNFDELYKKLNESMFMEVIDNSNEIHPSPSVGKHRLFSATGRALSDSQQIEHSAEILNGGGRDQRGPNSSGGGEEREVDDYNGETPFAVNDVLLSSFETMAPTTTGQPETTPTVLLPMQGAGKAKSGVIDPNIYFTAGKKAKALNSAEEDNDTPFVADSSTFSVPVVTTQSPSHTLSRIITQTTHAVRESEQFTKYPYYGKDTRKDEIRAPWSNSGIARVSTTTQEPTIPADIHSHGRVVSSEATNDFTSLKLSNGRYKVSGTKYYNDNRVYGESYGGSKNPSPYKIEEELRRNARISIGEEISEELREKKKRRKLGRKAEGQRTIRVGEGTREEPFSPSTVRMVDREGRSFEQRKTLIGGKEYTVELANQRLHGHDYLVAPGAIIHGPLIKQPQSKAVNFTRQPPPRAGGQTTFIGKRPQISVLPSVAGGLSEERTEEEEEKELEKEEQEMQELDRRLRQILDAQNQGLINPETAEKRLAAACFRAHPGRHLAGAPPIEVDTVKDGDECGRKCASQPDCLSAVHIAALSACHLLGVREGHASAQFLPLPGHTYYEMIEACRAPKHTPSTPIPKEEQNRQENPFGTQRLRALSSKDESEYDDDEADGPLRVVDVDDRLRVTSRATLPTREAQRPRLPARGAETTAIPARPGKVVDTVINKNAHCSVSEEALLVRSLGVRETQPMNTDRRVVNSEDDCVAGCLDNLAGYSQEFPCVSALYNTATRECSLSASLPSQLSAHADSVFYEKICVEREVSALCSGGVVSRRPSTLLVGYLRDAITAPSTAACLAECVTSAKRRGFECRSVLYYFEESELNCILNDGSAEDHPDALQVEKENVVDYFGVDACYGIPEIEKGNAIQVSDDVRSIAEEEFVRRDAPMKKRKRVQRANAAQVQMARTTRLRRLTTMQRLL